MLAVPIISYYVKNKALKQGLAGLVAGMVIAMGTSGLTGCSNPKNDIYSRIDKSTTLSDEEKQEYKKEYQKINLNNLTNEQKEFLSYCTKEKRKELAKEYSEYIKDTGFMDPNNLTDEDFIVIGEGIKYALRWCAPP